MNLLTRALSFLFPESCLVCGESGTTLHPSCVPSLRKSDGNLASHIITLFSYKDPGVQKLIWKIKFDSATHVVEALREEVLSHTRAFEKDTLIVPVPLGKARARERGFNQAEIIASLIGTPSLLLRRVRETAPQSHAKSRTERFENMKDVFEVTEKEKVEGKTILLVDDVITTGATTTSARETLLKSGAKSVYIFALAH